jgi:putative spermidine/putrescine transport system substrate-binding protein
MSPHLGGRLTRRGFLLEGAAVAAALGALPSASVAARRGSSAFTGTLRVLGDGLGQHDAIRKQAEQDLGFRIAFETSDPHALVDRAITRPGLFDVLSYYHFGFGLIWPQGSLRPVDTRKIVRWGQVSSLFKLGKVRTGDPRCTYGQGDAPFRSMYVGDSAVYPVAADKPSGANTIVLWVDERSGKPYHGLPEPRYVNGVPGILNMDSIGYDASVIDRPPEKVSWGELLNRRWKGRVALGGGAQVGLQDAAIAAEASGLMHFRDKGDMTRKEIDSLVKILTTLKRNGHFHGFWETSNASAVDFMRSREVVVESMWALHVMELQRLGFPVRYAAPPEGLRGWSGALGISSAIEDPARLQAAYDYVNWWHAGFPGAQMMHAGLYTAVQSTSRRFVDPAEWDYWIEGKPAAKDLPGLFGDATIRRGQVRDGGSFAKRACRYASWNSVFRELRHQERRWQDFLTA